MITDLPLPDRKTLRKLIAKCRSAEAFDAHELQHLANVLVALDHDAMYALRERMAIYEAEAQAEASKVRKVIDEVAGAKKGKHDA